MDIDSIEENEHHFEKLQEASSSSSGPSQTVVLDENHPFDLESYISQYKGTHTILDRLVHIIPRCPSLAGSAVQIALQHVPSLRDVNMYRTLRLAYDQAVKNAANSLPPLEEVIPLDQKWIDETITKNNAERTKLEIELNTYTSNMIKESIRMGHRDLAEFYRVTGDPTSALKHYSKSREYCTTPQHILDTCLSILELLIEQRNYAHIPTYTFKAESALDSTTIARPLNPPGGGAGAGGREGGAPVPRPQPTDKERERMNAEKERVQTKLDAATALSYLGQGNYDKAAATFVKIGPMKCLEEWGEKFITPSDIAIYTTLCALATLDRSGLQTKLLENDTFGAYLESEPYVREILEAYMGNRFKTVLDNLEKYSTRHSLCPHLAPHLLPLTNQIRARALVQYFRPFASIKLQRMSEAFGWEMHELEHMLVTLIGKGEISARVDKMNMVLKAKETDQRAALFSRIIQAGESMQSTNRKLLLRMRLQQTDLVIKPSQNRPTGVGLTTNSLLNAGAIGALDYNGGYSG